MGQGVKPDTHRRSDIVSLLHEVEDITEVHDQMLGQVLHVGPGGRVLADLERVGGVLLQQVLDPLVVDLEVADLRAERRSLGLARLDLLEERLADPRDQPALLLRPHHRVRLARPRLPVGEHAGVVPGERVLDHVRAEVVVDALLVDEVRVGGAVRPVGVVEGELVHGHPALLAALLMLAGLEVDLVAHGGHDTVAVPLDLPGRRKCYLFKFNQINENLGDVVTHLLLKGRTRTATLTEAMMDSFCGRGEVLKRSRTLGESPAKGYFRPETR